MFSFFIYAAKERERPGFGSREEDSKFDNPWRRDGPLPDSRDSSRRRFDGPREDRLPSVAEGVNDWRSNKPRAPLEAEGPSPAGSLRRKGAGFSAESAGIADSLDTWTMGSRFKPSAEEEKNGKFGGGSTRGRGDMGPPRDIPLSDEGDWRSSRRPPIGRNSSSRALPSLVFCQADGVLQHPTPHPQHHK